MPYHCAYATECIVRRDVSILILFSFGGGAAPLRAIERARLCPIVAPFCAHKEWYKE